MDFFSVRGSAVFCFYFVSIARLLLGELERRGYEVFLDLETLGRGQFNVKLLQQIESSSNFVLILSPRSLDRCMNKGDWVHKEIAHALKKGINIVPVLTHGFVFPTKLPDDINAVNLNHEYFEAFVSKLESFFVDASPEVAGSEKASEETKTRTAQNAVKDSKQLLKGADREKGKQNPARRMTKGTGKKWIGLRQ